ncbi:hypothetical protein [Amycolatopsis sp. DSM 110486]|uniref:hypothetical protein n=1 Tax=Amycolatopsis sp. DSM 110486 TaxID=2865832 RepID=UPI001C6A11A1|nr:hypothetical protein [Amycolatopsis sp. DSM 110486]QYN18973.1 hypothetical protein K1T34_40830 [Amycolatopsis sp. DSM 110486]
MTRRGLWWLLAVAVAAWAGSWRIIHLEVTRWHHLDSRLRFTPPPAPPGSPTPHAGLPVIAALVVAGAAPLVSVVAVRLLLGRASKKDTEQAAG